MISSKLIQLFQEMYELTEPECRLNCRCPHSCCSPEYCDIAEDLMKDEHVPIKYTDHPTLKFMGSHGCTVAPHLRPLCTLHTCDINSIGFKKNDPVWTKKYFKLRERIERQSRFRRRND